jgi:hypothetical protein
LIDAQQRPLKQFGEGDPTYVRSVRHNLENLRARMAEVEVGVKNPKAVEGADWLREAQAPRLFSKTNLQRWIPDAKLKLSAQGKELYSDTTRKGQVKVQRLFENTSDAKNWAKQQLGMSAERIYDDSGKWIGWKNQTGDTVYWGHGDWGKGSGLSNYPHLNFDIQGVKGHLFLKDKVINRGMWNDFQKEITDEINKLENP